MADTYTPNCHLTLMAHNDSNWDVVLNAIFSTLDGYGPIGGLCVEAKDEPVSTSLNVSVSAGSFTRTSDGTRVAVSAVPSQAVTASTTNYVYVTSGGTVTVNTTGYPAGEIVPLARVVTSGTLVTSVLDDRYPLATIGVGVFVGAGTGHGVGLVPDPGATAGLHRYLGDDATWHGAFVGSGASHAPGLVPDPGATAGTSHYLREDGNWAVPGSATVFVASGAGHASGLVPDPGATAATTHYLREDATWAIPPQPSVFVASGAGHAAGLVPDPGGTSGSTHFLCENGTWVVPSGAGTLTGAALSAPTQFTAGGSFTSGSGTLTLAWNTQGANTFLRGPASGAAAAPVFGAIVTTDLPTTGLVITSHYGSIIVDTDGATITLDCNASDQHQVTIAGNRIIALTNDAVGQFIRLAIIQGSGGSHTITWPTGTDWGAAGAPALSTTAGLVDTVVFHKVGAGQYRAYLTGLGFSV